VNKYRLCHGHAALEKYEIGSATKSLVGVSHEMAEWNKMPLANKFTVIVFVGLSPTGIYPYYELTKW